jgi:Kef-type K+ transport system membrane component KefB
LAAIATATAPAATVAIIREYRAQGPLTETILSVVALDDALAIMLFGLVLTIDLKQLSTFSKTALQSDNLIIILGIVLLGIGLASISHTSALMTNMFLGLTLINVSSRNSDIVANLERLTPPIYCFFFVLAGANLNLKVFTTVGPTMITWGIIFVSARIIGKIVGAYVGGALSGASETIRKYLGLTLIPQAGVAIGLTLLITQDSSYFEFRSEINQKKYMSAISARDQKNEKCIISWALSSFPEL